MHAPGAPWIRWVGLLVCAAGLAGPVRPAGADDPSGRGPSSLHEVLEAIAAEDRAIAEGAVRLREAAAASAEARASLDSATKRFEQRLGAELARAPDLGPVEHLLRAETPEPDRMRADGNAREHLREAQALLARARTDNENLRIAGLAPREEHERRLASTVALLERMVRAADLLDAARTRTSAERTARAQALHGLRERVAAESQAESRLSAAHLERSRLFLLMNTRFAPLFLRSVKVTLDRQASGAPVYHAEVTPAPGSAAHDAQIAFLLDQMRGKEAVLEGARRARSDAEQRFLDVDARWHAMYRDYESAIQHSYHLKIGLELMDSGISILSEGAQPISVLYEALWRVGEAIRSDPRIDEPLLSATLVDYRTDLAARLQRSVEAAGKVDMGSDEEWLRASSESLQRGARWFWDADAIPRHLEDEQGVELLKGVGDTAVTETVKTFAMIGAKLDVPVLLSGPLEKPAFMLDDFVQMLAHDERSAREILDGMLREGPSRLGRWGSERYRAFIGGRDVAREVVDRVQESWLAGKGKDFLRSAVVTAGKELITEAQHRDMAAQATALGLLDIEWLLRRHEFVGRCRVYRTSREILAGIEAAIGRLIEERDRLFPRRTLTVHVADPLFTTDEAYVRLELSGPCDGVAVRAGAKELTQPASRDGSVELVLPAGTFTPGPVRLSVSAVSTRLRTGYDFDGDPTTVASYDAAPNAPLRMRGMEGVSDLKHSLTYVAPDTDGQLARLEYEPVRQQPEQVSPQRSQNIPEGMGRLLVVARAADGTWLDWVSYQLWTDGASPRFVRSGRSDAVQDVPPGRYEVKVVEHGVRSLPVAVTAGQLTLARVEPMGRVSFDITDGARRLEVSDVVVYRGREPQTWRTSFKEVDGRLTAELVPGAYTVSYRIGGGQFRSRVVIRAGEAAVIRGQPCVMRLRTLDADGQPLLAHVTVFPQSDPTYALLRTRSDQPLYLAPGDFVAELRTELAQLWIPLPDVAPGGRTVDARWARITLPAGVPATGVSIQKIEDRETVMRMVPSDRRSVDVAEGEYRVRWQGASGPQTRSVRVRAGETRAVPAD